MKKFNLLCISFIILASQHLHAGIQDYFQYPFEGLLHLYSKVYNSIFKAPTKQDLFNASRTDSVCQTDKDERDKLFFKMLNTSNSDYTSEIVDRTILKFTHNQKCSEYKLPFNPAQNSLPAVKIHAQIPMVDIVRQEISLNDQKYTLHLSTFTLPETATTRAALKYNYYTQSINRGLRNTAAFITVGALSAYVYRAGYFQQIGLTR